MSFSAIRKRIHACLGGIPRGARAYYAGLGIWLATTAMHIPDGYLSPVTCAVMFAVMLPFWYSGLKQLRVRVNARSAPLVSLLAAFSFIIMMFNFPLPGGTTAHAVGGTLIAIILGPEVAVMAISIALMIQAVFFGDGGILALGANCFNMAVVVPYIGYAVYRLAAGKSPVESPRRAWGAFAGGYIGLTVAAFFAGIEFGLQPVLFHTASGTPLYSPYPLSVAVPAMVLPHMLLASIVEGLVTSLVIVYLQRTNREILSMASDPASTGAAGRPARLRIFWIILAGLIAATPLGLLAPGTAWGEWGSKQLTRMGMSFIPRGLIQLEGLWGAPLAGYKVAPLGSADLGYIISAATGVFVIAVTTGLLVAVLTAGRPENRRGPTDPPE